MYTDILDQVTGGSGGGGTGRGGRSGGGGRSSATGTRSSTTSDDEIMVRFKAGRVTLEAYSSNSIETTPPPPPPLTNMGYSDTSSTDDETTTTTTTTVPETGISSTAANQKENHPPNSTKYHCVARPERGEVRLVKTTTTLLSTSLNPISYSWQWYSRSTDSVVETIPLLPSTTKVKHTFERVTLPNKKIYEQDRIYVWTQIPTTISKKTKLLEVVDEIHEKPIYRMYWMQDADPTTDDTIVKDVEKFFTEVATAATAAATAAITTTTSTTTTTTSQVDALSSILENLGMPQQQTSSTQDATATSSGMDVSASTTTTSGSRNQLTLADLQGAMASIQQQQQQSSSSSMVGPPLQDIITVDSVDAILKNPDACQRLLQYLPAEQQSIEYLRDNLNSSSMQSTLRTLTQMLVPSQDTDDDNNNNSNSNGSYTEYSNIIANFQLDPQDGEMALLQNNNPIEAFLNCIIASVEKEKDTDTNNNNNNEETTGEGNEDMEDENDDNNNNNNNNNKKDDDDNDVQMNE